MAVTKAMQQKITQLYVALLNRAPDSAGVGYWIAKLEAGASAASVAQEMYNVDTVRAKFPAILTNEEIIARFYVNVLGRPADADGLKYWTEKLSEKGATKGSILNDMIESVVSYTGTDAAGLKSQSLLNNKVTAALDFVLNSPDASDVSKATAALTPVQADPNQAELKTDLTKAKEAYVAADLLSAAAVKKATDAATALTKAIDDSATASAAAAKVNVATLTTAKATADALVVTNTATAKSYAEAATTAQTAYDTAVDTGVGFAAARDNRDLALAQSIAKNKALTTSIADAEKAGTDLTAAQAAVKAASDAATVVTAAITLANSTVAAADPLVQATSTAATSYNTKALATKDTTDDADGAKSLVTAADEVKALAAAKVIAADPAFVAAADLAAKAFTDASALAVTATTNSNAADTKAEASVTAIASLATQQTADTDVKALSSAADQLVLSAKASSDAAAAYVLAASKTISTADDALAAAAVTTAAAQVKAGTAAVAEAASDATKVAAWNGKFDPKTFLLTTSIDNGALFTGGLGDDVFNAFATTAQTLTGFDSLDGGSGNDTLNFISATGSNVTISTAAAMKNIETANLQGDLGIAADTVNWLGLKTLTVNNSGADLIKAAGTTAVTINSVQGTSSIEVQGGSTVNINATSATGGTITVGSATAPTGAIEINRYWSAAGNGGAVNVMGGTTINITTTNAGVPVNSTVTNGAATIVGGKATTSVSVISPEIVSANASRAGVVANTVAITDVNGGGASTAAGLIKSITVDSYTTLSITDNALETLNIAHGSGNIIVDNSSSLATVTNKTLALTANALTGGTLDDADIYTTLNITTTGANSTLANVTFGAATAVTLAGTKGLTLTSTAGLTALKTFTVSGTAGVTADLSAATITAVDTSATTGASKVTIDASKATFTGGAGADTVTNSAGTSTKAISLGAGDDSLTMTAVAATPTGKIDGGAGTDNLSMTAALAATASGSASFAGIVVNFENLTLSGATNQTVDLAVLGAGANSVTTSGGNGLTLSNLNSGGTLTLNGAGTAYTIGNSAFTAGTNDIVKLNLTQGTGAGVAFASTGVTASGAETFNITTADTQATPTGTFNDSITLLGNSVKTITVTGNAGLALTSTSTALTNVDASAIAGTDITPGFTWTSGALAAASTVKGSATGTNTIDASAATGGAVTYTGGSGNDSFTATNGKGNTITLGNGTNAATVSTGNNTITGGTGADTVIATTGNNVVSLGNGANAFTATTGNNTYTGGTGVDTVTLGGGSNIITLGTGADVVSITAASANVNTYSNIVDAHAGVTITFTNLGTETFNTTPVTLQSTAVFQDYANAVIQAGGNASTNGAFGWFQYNGDTYLVESRHDGSGNNASFVNGTDMLIKLTGLIDLSSSTVGGTATITIV